MKLLTILLVLDLATTSAFATDPGPLQDFCVVINSTKDADGRFCKELKLATADDFTFTRQWKPGNTSNPLGSKVTPGFIDQFLGINTLGVSMSRIDFAPYGLNPPHAHPRGSEILLVVKGTLYARFVTPNQLGNRFFAKVLYPGDLITIPMGLIHFQLNIGTTNAMALASFCSQNPGVMTIANSVFGAQPLFSVDVLTKAFQ